MQKAAKLNLLDHFYEHLSEEDWLEGVDIYQAGRVRDISTFEGLISARVSALHESAEVRLKIHPGGHCIQWIECTCRKNRSTGQYCQHIAAFMIHIDREKPELLGRLDSTMPLKPPVAPRKQRAVPKEAPDDTKKSQAGATHTIIDHLKGSIQGVSLIAHGPHMRVRIEIKPGHVTHYDLDTDGAAKFLLDHPDPEFASQEVRSIQVFGMPIEPATRIFQPEDEKIVAERGFILRPDRKFSMESPAARIQSEEGEYRRITAGGKDSKPSRCVFFSVKALSRHLGRQFAYIPGKGYFPLLKDAVNSTWGDLAVTKSYKDDDAAEFIRDNYRDYLASGPVYLDSNLEVPEFVDAPELSTVELIEEGDGWFRLDPRYGKGKASVSMVDLMIQHKKNKRKYIRSGNIWMKIPEFVTEHNWQLDATGEAVRVDALGLLRFKAAVGDFDQFVGSTRVLNTIRNRLEFTPESGEPVKHGTKINLRPYQETGLRWLQWLYRNHLHGLLADEMGLGKTHQAMAMISAIQHERPQARFLVICPTTVLDHWLDKIEDFAPNLKPVRYHGPKRLSLLRQLDEDRCTLITSYGVMLRDIKALGEREWDAVILDEAHFVKNNDTATYQAVCRLKSRIRICLTGTPMENHLGELKSLFDFLVPGYLGSDEYFRKNIRNPLEKGDNPEITLALQKLIYPFKLRRTKENVLPELPAKVEDLRHCGLSDEQVRLYRDVIQLKAAPIIEQLRKDEAPIPFLHVFATLTLLKQICDHPALIGNPDEWRKHHSGKFELLQELIAEAMDSGHKVVVFSQYVSMINIISQYLDEQKIGHVVLTGQSRNRGDLIRSFQENPEKRVFIGSLLAGGIGIDLTAASEVIHYDRWWNASKENQATDRVHRIGQIRNVQVMKLVTRGTLEEKIDRMIRNKQALFQKFLEKDEEIFRHMSRQELIELLQ